MAPHPDDETLAAGGLIATLLDAGWQVRVVAVTDGEAAFGRRDRALAARRQAEQAQALQALAGEGPAPVVTRLGLPDGAVADRADALVDALRPELAGADLVVAPVPWDGHPDHDACGAAAAVAAPEGAERAGYPVWAWHWMEPAAFPVVRARRLRLGPSAWRRKQRALDAFASQVRPAGDEPPILPPHVLARFERPFEVLVT